MTEPDIVAATLASYDAGVAAYLAAERPGPSPAARRLAERLTRGSVVLEIGSGPGTDARWLAEQGLDVVPSDACAGFRAHLEGQGLRPLRYDVAVDPCPVGAWDGVLANGVLHHLPRRGLAPALARLRLGLRPGAAVVLATKTGGEDGWTTEKLAGPRWFTYWDEADLRRVLTGAGLTVDACERTTGRTSDWLQVEATAR